MKHFEKRIENVKMNREQEIEHLKDSALVEFSRNLKLSGKFKLLEDALSKLESSKDLTTVEYDHEFMYQYIRFDFSDIIDVDSKLERELLVRFLEENDFFMIPDFENSVLTMSIGPVIVIDHDGDVYDQDSNKVILKKHDYETTEERNEKIEEYMEKTGCFPSVVALDYYGRPIGYVKTTKGA